MGPVVTPEFYSGTLSVILSEFDVGFASSVSSTVSRFPVYCDSRLVCRTGTVCLDLQLGNDPLPFGVVGHPNLETRAETSPVPYTLVFGGRYGVSGEGRGFQPPSAVALLGTLPDSLTRPVNSGWSG